MAFMNDGASFIAGAKRRLEKESGAGPKRRVERRKGTHY
jgi:hypothetical protein